MEFELIGMTGLQIDGFKTDPWPSLQVHWEYPTPDAGRTPVKTSSRGLDLI